METETETRRKLVAIGDRHFDEAAFQAVFNEEALAHLAKILKENSTARQSYYAVRSMKSRATHRAILGRTLRRLLETPNVEEKENVVVVARFPAILAAP